MAANQYCAATRSCRRRLAFGQPKGGETADVNTWALGQIPPRGGSKSLRPGLTGALGGRA
jgi:hypothetical protein